MHRKSIHRSSRRVLDLVALLCASLFGGCLSSDSAPAPEPAAAPAPEALPAPSPGRALLVVMRGDADPHPMEVKLTAKVLGAIESSEYVTIEVNPANYVLGCWLQFMDRDPVHRFITVRLAADTTHYYVAERVDSPPRPGALYGNVSIVLREVDELAGLDLVAARDPVAGRAAPVTMPFIREPGTERVAVAEPTLVPPPDFGEAVVESTEALPDSFEAVEEERVFEAPPDPARHVAESTPDLAPSDPVVSTVDPPAVDLEAADPTAKADPAEWIEDVEPDELVAVADPVTVPVQPGTEAAPENDPLPEVDSHADANVPEDEPRIAAPRPAEVAQAEAESPVEAPPTEVPTPTPSDEEVAAIIAEAPDEAPDNDPPAEPARPPVKLYSGTQLSEDRVGHLLLGPRIYLRSINGNKHEVGPKGSKLAGIQIPKDAFRKEGIELKPGLYRVVVEWHGPATPIDRTYFGTHEIEVRLLAGRTTTVDGTRDRDGSYGWRPEATSTPRERSQLR